MMLAREEKKAPRQIAEVIVEALGSDPLWAKVEIAGPGFINLFIANQSWYSMLDEVIQKQGEFGKSNFGAGRKVQVEFVSANPQGRLVSPEEVASAVAWLCLPGSESINGQSIAVAGGEVM